MSKHQKRIWLLARNYWLVWWKDFQKIFILTFGCAYILIPMIYRWNEKRNTKYCSCLFSLLMLLSNLLNKLFSSNMFTIASRNKKSKKKMFYPLVKVGFFRSLSFNWITKRCIFNVKLYLLTLPSHFLLLLYHHFSCLLIKQSTELKKLWTHSSFKGFLLIERLKLSIFFVLSQPWF